MDYMPKEKTIEVWKKTNWNIVSVTCDFFFCQLQTAHTNTGKLALTLHSRRQGPLFLSVCTRFWKPEWPLFSPPLSPFAPQVLWQQLLHSYNGESFFSPQCSLDASFSGIRLANGNSDQNIKQNFQQSGHRFSQIKVLIIH